MAVTSSVLMYFCAKKFDAYYTTYRDDSTLHFPSINSNANANNNKNFKEIKNTSTSTTYNVVNSVRLENVAVSSFWILLSRRYLHH